MKLWIHWMRRPVWLALKTCWKDCLMSYTRSPVRLVSMPESNNAVPFQSTIFSFLEYVSVIFTIASFLRYQNEKNES